MIAYKNWFFPECSESRSRKFIMTAEIKDRVFDHLVELSLRNLNIESIECFSRLNTPHFRTLVLDGNPIITL